MATKSMAHILRLFTLFFFGMLVGRMFDNWFDGQPFSDKIVLYTSPLQ